MLSSFDKSTGLANNELVRLLLLSGDVNDTDRFLFCGFTIVSSYMAVLNDLGDDLGDDLDDDGVIGVIGVIGVCGTCVVFRGDIGETGGYLSSANIPLVRWYAGKLPIASVGGAPGLHEIGNVLCAWR